MSDPLNNMDDRRNEAVKMLEQYNEQRNEVKILRVQFGQSFNHAPLGDKTRDLRRRLEKAEEQLAAHTETILGLMGVDQ